MARLQKRKVPKVSYLTFSNKDKKRYKKLQKDYEEIVHYGAKESYY